jgi:hypothetical protein
MIIPRIGQAWSSHSARALRAKWAATLREHRWRIAPHS